MSLFIGVSTFPPIFTTDVATILHAFFSFFPHPRSRSKDCRFHMIMHAQYWDGRSLSHFNENDMSNIRNILTYKWIKYEENDTAWETILNMKI
jgi:hypothetical protein